jgi:hypothetical protein
MAARHPARDHQPRLQPPSGSIPAELDIPVIPTQLAKALVTLGILTPLSAAAWVPIGMASASTTRTP